MFAMLGSDQIFVSPSSVCIADHNVGRNEFAVGQFNTTGFAVFNANLRHWRIAGQLNAARFQQAHHALHDGARTAHGRVNAPCALQRINQCISGRD